MSTPLKPQRPITLQDVTLRDGMHAIRHAYSLDDVRTIASGLDCAGIDVIEVAHGDGLGGSSLVYGIGAQNDLDWIEAAADVVRLATVTTLIIPGIGTASDLRDARVAGVKAVRVATDCAGAALAKPLLNTAVELGLHATGFLMMSHRLSPKSLAAQAKILEANGAACIFLADSAGTMIPSDVMARVTTLRDELRPETEIGFHAHHNLTLGVANALAAVEAGATRLDASLAGMGAGAGNAPMEVLAAVGEKAGWRHEADIFLLMDLAEDIVRPMQARPVRVDRSTQTLGYAGVYSSFLLHAEDAAKKSDLDVRDILMEIARQGLIGGQEDQIPTVIASLRAGKSSSKQFS